MKTQFIKPALFVLLGIFLGMYFLRCGNDAGIGSDFDATKYYTKDDIDQMMANYYTQSEVDNAISKNKSSIIAGKSGLNANQTLYVYFDGASLTESDAQILAPVNGVLRNLFVRSDSDGWNPGSNVEVTVRVNGSNTSLALNYSINDTNTIKSNTTDTAIVNQSDLISVRIRETGGATAGLVHISFLFDAAE